MGRRRTNFTFGAKVTPTFLKVERELAELNR
jgi:hypothetical protein